MAWSERQQLVLALVPKFSSTLSFCGSLWITVEVFTGIQNGNNRLIRNIHHPYHRLLLAMSLYDLMECGWNFLGTWPIPKGTDQVWSPLGNQYFCSAQGFFLQLSVAVPIYNAMLSIYYVLVVLYGMRDTQLARRIEPAMHATAFVWGMGTALTAACMGLINNANLWCWIAPYPAGCLDSLRYPADEANCERGDNAWLYRWTFYFGPLWLCILVSIVCTSMVVMSVKKLDRKTHKYRNPEASTRSSGGVAAPSSVFSTRSELRGEGKLQQQHAPPSSELLEPVRGTEPGSAERTNRQSDPPNSPANDNERHLALIEWWKRKREFAIENPRTHQVQMQSFYYVLTFLLTHAWSTTSRIIQQLPKETAVPFAVVLLHSFFDPLQGLLNFVVYQRPRYLRIRKHHPQESRWFALKGCLEFSKTSRWDWALSSRLSFRSRTSSWASGGSVARNAKRVAEEDDGDEEEQQYEPDHEVELVFAAESSTFEPSEKVDTTTPPEEDREGTLFSSSPFPLPPSEERPRVEEDGEDEQTH